MGHEIDMVLQTVTLSLDAEPLTKYTYTLIKQSLENL